MCRKNVHDVPSVSDIMTRFVTKYGRKNAFRETTHKLEGVLAGSTLLAGHKRAVMLKTASK